MRTAGAGDWSAYRPCRARRRAHVRDIPLEELVRHIDWMPFFNAWEFAGRFPDVLTDPVVGEAASDLYAGRARMLKQMITGALAAPRQPSVSSRLNRSATTRGVCG